MDTPTDPATDPENIYHRWRGRDPIRKRAFTTRHAVSEAAAQRYVERGEWVNPEPVPDTRVVRLPLPPENWSMGYRPPASGPNPEVRALAGGISPVPDETVCRTCRWSVAEAGIYDAKHGPHKGELWQRLACYPPGRVGLAQGRCADYEYEPGTT